MKKLDYSEIFDLKLAVTSDHQTVCCDTHFQETFREWHLQVCDFLQYSAGATFEATVLGNQWTLDVAYDFACIITELPILINCINHGQEARLSFFEQGVERDIVFTKCLAGITVGVTDIVKGPVSHSEYCPTFIVTGSLVAVITQFTDALTDLAIPKPAWYSNWLSLTYISS